MKTIINSRTLSYTKKEIFLQNYCEVKIKESMACDHGYLQNK